MSSDTKGRILATAQRLFTEQGFEATSLRQIADELGFTKAAVWYHFQSKDEILLELLEPADRMLSEFLDRLTAAADAEGWADALTWVIDQLFDNMEFFKLVERNRAAIETVQGSLEERMEHHRLHERVEVTVREIASSYAEQVRMVAAIGAVTGFDDWAPRLLTESDPQELHDELGAAVRDVLGLRRRRKKAAAAAG